MERVKGKHYIYNPYVLNLLYSKVIFLHRLHDVQWRCVVDEEHDNERRAVIRNNQYDQLVVSDVCELVRLMREEKFRFDLYYANYEYILYRMLSLFYASDCNHIGQSPLEPVDTGDPFGCEIKCMTVIDSQEERRIFTEAVTQYVALHYFNRVGDCVARARQRAILLFNIKRTVEQAVARQYGAQRDYTVTYTKDVVTTMLYLLLVNEFLAHAQLESENHSLRHGSILPRPIHIDRGMCEEIDYIVENRCESDRRTDALANKVTLLKRLSRTLSQQYEDEFRGFSVINAFPEYPSPLPEGAMDSLHFGDYVRSGCVMESVRLLRSVRHDVRNFTMKEITTENLHYISLQRNRCQYEYITRRFMFDHELLLQHTVSCHGDRPLVCHTCRYAQDNQTLADFYHQATRNAYNTCHYIVRNSPKLANESLLHLFLAPVIVDLLSPLDSVFYKNCWQLLRLAGTGQALYEMVDLRAIVGHIHAHYDKDEGGSDTRLSLVLRQAYQRLPAGKASRSFRNPVHVTEQQTKLVIDIDMVLCITRAICAQQNEIERYERSLCHGEHTAKADGSPHKLKKLIVDMTALYNLYMKYLVEAVDQ